MSLAVTRASKDTALLLQGKCAVKIGGGEDRILSRVFLNSPFVSEEVHQEASNLEACTLKENLAVGRDEGVPKGKCGEFGHKLAAVESTQLESVAVNKDCLILEPATVDRGRWGW